mgnify:CR=1 FL=1
MAARPAAVIHRARELLALINKADRHRIIRHPHDRRHQAQDSSVPEAISLGRKNSSRQPPRSTAAPSVDLKNAKWARRIAQRISPELCGTVLWLGWVVLTLISSAFAYGVTTDKRPVLTVTTLLVAMSAVHLYAVFRIYRASRNAISLKTVVGFALAMRFVAVFSTPIQELDYYRYLWDGETVLAQVQVDVPAGTVVDYTIGG